MGNTSNQIPTKIKQVNKAVKWVFTFNNYCDNDILEIVPILNEKCVKYVFQEEKGENGTKHLQGAILVKEKIRPTELNLSKKIHWEACKYWEESVKYCQKEATRNGKIYTKGIPLPVKIIEKLFEWQQKLVDEVYLTEPDGRSVHWIVDEIGGKGKSQFAKYMCVKYSDVTCVQRSKYENIINHLYNIRDQHLKMLIIDIPRKNGNNVSYDAVECILNGMIFNTKYETGTHIFNPPHIIILSNYYPDEECLSADRWKIRVI